MRSHRCQPSISTIVTGECLTLLLYFIIIRDTKPLAIPLQVKLQRGKRGTFRCTSCLLQEVTGGPITPEKKKLGIYTIDKQIGDVSRVWVWLGELVVSRSENTHMRLVQTKKTVRYGLNWWSPEKNPVRCGLNCWSPQRKPVRSGLNCPQPVDRDRRPGPG